MGLAERNTLISQLVPPLDNLLATQLIDEFISVERRFIQRDWEPAELDGGQFAEILIRILYHIDSGNLNASKKFEECAKYLENNQVNHSIQPQSHALHILRVLQAIYKFRSGRGAVHISPHYEANHMDAKLVIECVRWCMNETLRLFWNGDREVVARTIRELLQFDVPVIGIYENVLLVQRTDLRADEEMLILLHYAGEQGFTRTELGKYSQFKPPAVTKALQKLVAPDCKQIILLPSDRYRLTDLGSKWIRERLADKLLLS